MSSRRLTIYLLRADVIEVSDAIAPGKSLRSISLDPGSGVDGAFYFTSRPASIPAWLSFVQPILATPSISLTTSSASGLLVIKANKRYFAITFGYGRSLLNLAKFEHQFGLRVALNRIDPRQIRSMDTKTFEDMVVTRNTQASKSSELPAFGVDISRDILRAVTGEPKDQALAKRISGSDALVLNVDTSPTDLPKVCAELLVAFNDDAFKSEFDWIDHLALVGDPDTIHLLNSMVVDQLRVGDTSNTHIAMPEVIEWEDIDVFKMGGTGGREYDDLDLDDYLSRLGSSRADITIDRLKQRRVSVRFSRSGEFDTRWSVFQCLVTEQRLKSRLHVLIEGRWFVVSDSLVAEVDAFVAGLESPHTALVSGKAGEAESDYNVRLANSSPSNLLLLDAKIKRPGGASSGIELCDVFASNGEFIHVKRKSRSSTLSHLFAQGRVSATTFVSDGTFRDAIRESVKKDTAEPARSMWLGLIPADGQSVDRSKYAVAYVIITNTSRMGTNWLPFFSKLNLMQNGRGLRSLGFRVSVSRVAISD